MTSSHQGPYDQGYTRATMAHTKRSDLARASGPHKVRRSPDLSVVLLFIHLLVRTIGRCYFFPFSL